MGPSSITCQCHLYHILLLFKNKGFDKVALLEIYSFSFQPDEMFLVQSSRVF